MGLIAALAVVAYMIILQWQHDYVVAPKQAALASAVEQQSNTSQPLAAAPTDLPTATPSAPVGEDVPVVPTASMEAPSVLDKEPELGDQLIQVETDVLSLAIDRRGGDIVRVGLKDYPAALEQPDVPFTLLNLTSGHTYVSQSGLIGPDGPDSSKEGRPLYRSDAQNYQLQGDELVVSLYFTQPSGAKIEKQFTFTRGEHNIDVTTKVDNQSAQPWQGLFYGQIKRDGSPDPGLDNSMSFGLPTFLGAAYWDIEKPYNKIKFKKMAEEPLNKDIPGGWLAMIQHYFITAWIPNQELVHRYQTRVAKGNYIIGFTSPMVAVAPGESHQFAAQFYAGPKKQRTLEALVPDKGLDLAIDYGPLFFISKTLFWFLEKFHALTGNWGFAIIMLTILVKLLFYYPSAISYRSMAKMRKVAPELTRIREQCADDRQKLSQEMMKLYQKEKINPLSGCLPILIQMPVFLALYWALLESVELRQAPFILWINDLSVMDPYFVLPLLMGVSMYVQQLLHPAPPDPMQAKVMKFMPVLFTVMFLWFPAGLVLYWVTNNILSVAQQYVITRQIEGAS